MLPQRTQWNSTACRSCRRRRRKCDRRLPECETCVRRGLRCEGYILRLVGVAARGKFAHKAMPFVGSTSLDGRHSTKENHMRTRRQVVSDALASVQKTESLPAIRLSEYSPKLNLASWLPSSFETPLLSVTEQLGTKSEIMTLFTYYIQDIAPTFCLDLEKGSRPSNPYIDYIGPLAFQTPCLLYAILSVTFCQQYVRSGAKEKLQMGLKCRGISMGLLQQSLNSRNSAMEAGTLVCILMLMHYEVGAGGFGTFQPHLAGARRIMQGRGEERTPGSFVEQQIIILDVMGSTSSSRSSTFSVADIQSFTKSTDAHNCNWNNDLFACPVDLFEAILDITSLYKSQIGPGHSKVSLDQILLQKERVISWQSSSAQSDIQFHLTEAFRYGIILYLLRLFNLMTDLTEIRLMIENVICHIDAIPASSGWGYQSIWPLFQAGIVVTCDEERNWFRRRLIEMQQSSGCSVNAGALKALERQWSLESTDWDWGSDLELMLV